jgi:hypothetical protein
MNGGPSSVKGFTKNGKFPDAILDCVLHDAITVKIRRNSYRRKKKLTARLIRTEGSALRTTRGAAIDLRSIDLMLAKNAPPFPAKAGCSSSSTVIACSPTAIRRQKEGATTWYPEIVQALPKIRGSYVIDGEICLLDERGVPDFEGMRNRALLKRGEQVTYFTSICSS